MQVEKVYTTIKMNSICRQKHTVSVTRQDLSTLTQFYFLILHKMQIKLGIQKYHIGLTLDIYFCPKSKRVLSFDCRTFQAKQQFSTPTFQNLIVLSLVDRRKTAELAVWHHLILLIFSSISKLLR
ncbi:LOW QUALITY PROTEIN: hypothetical protein PanWU01x14_333880 [Parasponia andersonii]|uniref:Uncharacterized protein n=1 Tax=Parasponia andersonii TaxID=3476 RepID=A0A2P5AGS8_PARAD|nr:LOW QUALITY PROTEIN: hypothetical protein PanWU01x14_333880 [Parasponia andersonii]